MAAIARNLRRRESGAMMASRQQQEQQVRRKERELVRQRIAEQTHVEDVAAAHSAAADSSPLGRTLQAARTAVSTYLAQQRGGQAASAPPHCRPGAPRPLTRQRLGSLARPNARVLRDRMLDAHGGRGPPPAPTRPFPRHRLEALVKPIPRAAAPRLRSVAVRSGRS